MIKTRFMTYQDAGRVACRLVAAAGMVLAAGCTMTPWTDSWQPVRAAPPTSSASGVMAGYYRVNPGDTLGGIATAFGQRPQDVAYWNHLAVTDMVTPGQVLRVAPPPVIMSLGAPVPAPASSAPAALAWPAQGAVTSGFAGGKNQGIVITARGGDRTVRAAAAGRVVYAGTGVAAYGPLVIVKHDNGLITAYGHAGKLLVNEGDAVSAGQPVAEMATDAGGRASFEFEVRENGKPVDPLGFLPRNGG